jgi:hypothetical protein
MTLGDAAAAGVRIIVWCKACQRQVEPNPAELAERYGAGVSLCWIGAIGSSVPGAAAAITTWC